MEKINFLIDWMFSPALRLRSLYNLNNSIKMNNDGTQFKTTKTSLKLLEMYKL